jgi:class 3 adenylate cyclase
LGDISIDAIMEDGDLNLQFTVAALSASISVVALFFLLGIISGLVFARTITGPWQRLNILQENTIRRFVPQGFLRLINCTRVTDVQLGTHVEKNVAMLLVEIKDFDQITANMNPKEVLHLLNNFLNHICPIVRRHNGFVDRYNYDGFSALFKSSRDVTNASLEVQSGATSFNQIYSNLPTLRLGISIHASHVLIGTIGENERMDGAILSREARLNSHLQSLNDKLKAPIIVTRQVLPNTRPENCRSLGETIDKYHRRIEIFEIFSDPVKKKTRELFDAAVKEFINYSYYNARKIFSEVQIQDETDQVAKVYKDLCSGVIEKCESQIEQLDVEKVLAIPTLEEKFEQHCRKELSTENLRVYKLVNEYRQINDLNQRRVFVESLYRQFLSVDSESEVNVTDTAKRNIKVRLDENVACTNVMLDELQREMKANMHDTLSRFKHAEACRESYLANMVATMHLKPLL